MKSSLLRISLLAILLQAGACKKFVDRYLSGDPNHQDEPKCRILTMKQVVLRSNAPQTGKFYYTIEGRRLNIDIYILATISPWTLP
jgi:hypothetical protein